MSTHGIRLPGQILDQIKTSSGNGEHDERQFVARKRRTNRKDKRKEERQIKKQKRSQNGTKNGQKSAIKHENGNYGAERTPKSVKGTKERQKSRKKLTNEEAHDDESESEVGEESDFGGFESDENDQDTLGSADDSGDFDSDFGDDFGESDEDDYGDLEMVDNPLEQLRKIKAHKAKEKEDPLEQLRKIKEEKKKKESKNSKKEERKAIKKSKNEPVAPVDSHTMRQLEQDEQDIAYWSKKLGLKGGKKGKLTAQDENDVVGGLLDGLDFIDEIGAESAEEGEEGGENSEDFNLSENESNESFSSESESGSDSDGGSENPYVAPTKYIPPAVRREQESESSENIALKRAIKGPLNKLSESNISSIVNEIIGQFSSNPRQIVNETITSIVIDSIVSQGRLLDTFVYLHAAVVAAIYRIRGIDFGAYFIQTLVEKYDSSDDQNKARFNLITLLSSVYAFGLVSANLIYDFIKLFINDLGEDNAEILLRLIRTSGNQLRSEDPSALKEIVVLTNKAAANIPKDLKSTRLQFLVETISSLKNNKLKIHSEATFQLITRLRKYLSSIKSSKLNDPIQVSISDIRNIDTVGKWWLVGSAWKGSNQEEKEDFKVNEPVDMDLSEPNWLELAKAQRMNTDVRRAVFISIMSAEDYMDAITKLDKLGLKKAQQKDIPRILMHCASVEPAWNPYYGLLASKLCESHSHRKSLQFMLWDLIKELDGSQDDDSEPEDFPLNEDLDDEQQLKRALNLGRLFGFLFSEESLPLHLLKNVNFLTASGDLTVFLELAFVTFFDRVAKKSKHGKSMDDSLHLSLLSKMSQEPTLMKGLKLFIQKLQTSEYVTSAKQRARVEWGIESATTILEELIANSDNV
ncbi:hypothetical protein PGUG_00288 [Meyerozyma guilliermondii ATCC 6260]|uniref:MI domain-containing protein n=1 Tax=Meyerozyma guilliermondii (strain ATCC 6260 / CBS 566 / DSM 6381 / JCM 1539 / NBRC 10279 / NRRL Y-324) TaxID=294746 RepID=A5DAI3_PICGU|nr:uncharacterized protein PGUG_00288 [Meyerozyma guilliermondii ATCC 6260]EDK36190.2 hypothetical protein PGUG_00288 [Meyerozyma guilliermondii ATCC 6260]